jgi:predicted ribosomally synthesized peptide with SipW-like signal peptide
VEVDGPATAVVDGPAAVEVEAVLELAAEAAAATALLIASTMAWYSSSENLPPKNTACGTLARRLAGSGVWAFVPSPEAGGRGKVLLVEEAAKSGGSSARAVGRSRQTWIAGGYKRDG